MSSPKDYQGRTFDVSAFQLQSSLPSVPVEQSLFNSGGTICTGIQKLMQRWVLEFMTPRGSMGFHLASRGSEFMTWVTQGFVRSDYDIRVYFNFAAQQVKTALLNEDTADTPSDERLLSATLQSASLSDGQLALSINIISIAGDARQVILPIAILPTTLTLPE